MKDPRELPELEIDFRSYARKLLATEDLAEAVRSALDTEVRSRAIVFGGRELPAKRSGEKSELAALLEKGVLAAQKTAADPEAPLTADEDFALEAVVRLQERPALLVRRNSFAEPPGRWERLGSDFRTEVERRLPSTGRIDVKPGEMAGTGFVVGEELVMTNRHVVELFADPPPSGEGSWAIFSKAAPTIDFRVEHGEPEKRVFKIREVVGVHSRQDMALVRVARQATEPEGAPLPDPMKLASSTPNTNTGLDLYAIGYPWTDNENVTPPAVIEAIYDGIFQVKRLQPGEFHSTFDAYGVFSHDCSTLGGNSGSCIIDLKTDRTIGLHYKGKYRQANYAVALWQMKDDALFRERGLRF
jgi:glutamyl endopeptidase